MSSILSSQTVADFILERVHQWGVRRVFGFPGDGINGLIGAFDRIRNKLAFIQTRHEEMAAFMACAHAKFTGEVGVCTATSGPGAIHLLNGLYDAKLDHQPVVAIIGQQASISLGAHYQQEVDLITLYKDVASPFVEMVITPSQARHCIDRAFRIAMAHRCVTCVIIPRDIQEMPAEASPPRKHGAAYSSVGYNFPDVVPREADLNHAATILNEGEKVAMLIGIGAKDAEDEVMEVAELLGAGVAKALLGKAVLSDDLPYVTGAIGLLGTRPSWDMMMNCDTLLMIGTGFPYSEFLPKEGQARCVQIDIKAEILGLRYPCDVPLQGDARLTLKALIPRLRYKTDRSWRRGIEEGIKDWWELMEDRAMLSADPINPQRVFWELSSKLPDNCILTCDSGSSANWFARDLKVRHGMMASLSGTLATMCPGVPYAIAAKMAYPERVVIAMVGDGAMQMLGNDGLVTIKKFWKDWSDPRLIVLVLNNQDLNQVTWEQRVLSGDPKFPDSQTIPDFPYAAYAELLGLKGIELDNPKGIGEAWDRALSADRPVVIDAHVDPDVPPLPPHITFRQARHFMTAMFKADEDVLGISRQSMKEMLQSWLPAGVR